MQYDNGARFTVRRASTPQKINGHQRPGNTSGNRSLFGPHTAQMDSDDLASFYLMLLMAVLRFFGRLLETVSLD